MNSLRMPGEWEHHKAVWLAWPSAQDLWLENIGPARDEFVALCRAIADVDPTTGVARGERLNILVPTPEDGAAAEARLSGLPVKLHLIPFGDIWLRDTAPLFLTGPQGVATVRFAFNGWGGKYLLEHDDQVATRIARSAGYPEFSIPWVLEGGSVELDGEGTCLTSRQCLLNPNRNPSMSQADLEAGLKESLNVDKVLWLGDGLINDHTDGHIDTIARFVAPGKVLCMTATRADDPNRDILARIEKDLRAMTDARGRKLEVGLVPSPGAIHDTDGQLMPASFLNFYIANTTVVVPTYGSPMDAEAVAAIARWFPSRKTVGLSAKAILSGGGAFHCISQQEPDGQTTRRPEGGLK